MESGHRRFPFQEMAKLESDERKAAQPADPLVATVLEAAPRVVLDVGVGTGYFALPIARGLQGGSVVGLDVESRMLDAFLQRAGRAGLSGRVRTALGSVDRAGAVPLDDGSVDVALMANLYHELDDRKAALREIRRVLADGARLVVCDWDPEAASGPGPPKEHRVAAETVERDLRAAGFTAVERRALYGSLYTFVAS